MRTRSGALRRRIVTVPAVGLAAVGTTVTMPLWVPAVVLVDVIGRRRRRPLTRLSLFGWWWAWHEVGGVALAFRLWATGRRRDHDAHYALMARWSAGLMRGLDLIGGIRVDVQGLDELRAGDAIVVSRHASFADSLVSGWVTSALAGLRPRYVLKRELLVDPCLDIVGLRLPNHFIDRSAVDNDAELGALQRLAAGIGPGDVAVIFAEGTRATPAKRRRALEKIAERDVDRARELSALRHLLPPRAAGTRALLDGAPSADVVLAWHTGFDGFDSPRGMLARLAEPPVAARFVLRRVPRGSVDDDDFAAWLDQRWLELDEEVDRALANGAEPSPAVP